MPRIVSTSEYAIDVSIMRKKLNKKTELKNRP